MKRFLPAFLLAVGLVSCTKQVYTPTSFNVPLLEKKGDLNGSLLITPSVKTWNGQLQASFGLTEKFGLIGAFYFNSE